mgnify:CR=1 FL=1
MQDPTCQARHDLEEARAQLSSDGLPPEQREMIEQDTGPAERIDPKWLEIAIREQLSLCSRGRCGRYHSTIERPFLL